MLAFMVPLLHCFMLSHLTQAVEYIFLVWLLVRDCGPGLQVKLALCRELI